MFKVLGVFLHLFVTSYKTVYGIKRNNTNNKYTMSPLSGHSLTGQKFSPDNEESH